MATTMMMEVTVVAKAVKETMDFHHKNIKGCFETRKGLIFSCLEGKILVFCGFLLDLNEGILNL